MWPVHGDILFIMGICTGPCSRSPKSHKLILNNKLINKLTVESFISQRAGRYPCVLHKPTVQEEVITPPLGVVCVV